MHQGVCDTHHHRYVSHWVRSNPLRILAKELDGLLPELRLQKEGVFLLVWSYPHLDEK